MGLEPISIKNMEEKTNDLYEAVVVMSKKAKQVINERTMDKLMRVSDQTEMGVFDDEENINPEDYEELTKPTTVAVDSFVSGDLEWTKKSSESDSQWIFTNDYLKIKYKNICLIISVLNG